MRHSLDPNVHFMAFQLNTRISLCRITGNIDGITLDMAKVGELTSHVVQNFGDYPLVD